MSEPTRTDAGPVGGKPEDNWERWQRGVIQFLVLALKIISAAAIIALFAIAEYAAVRSVARALATETVNSAPRPSSERAAPPGAEGCIEAGR